MYFHQFMECAKQIPTNISVLIRGKHGIGKSQSVYQLAEHFGLPVIERRLSQMSEGDMIGLPVVTNGVTAFLPPDWYKQACDTPVVLFLDELNRATAEVMQAAFQIVLDRTLNGHKLHPETRIYAAVNNSEGYQVNDIDPALLDRFWVSDLTPSVKDWIDWAEKTKRVHTLLVDFVREHQNHLEPDVDPGKKAGSRRSYERLSDVLVNAGIVDKPDNELYYNLSVGLIGVEAAAALVSYVKDTTRVISAEEILNQWDTVAERIAKLGQERWNICIEKVIEYCDSHKMTKQQASNFARFFVAVPKELSLVIWNQLIRAGAENEITRHNALCCENIEIMTRIFDALNRKFENSAGLPSAHACEQETPTTEVGKAPAKKRGRKPKKTTTEEESAEAKASENDDEEEAAE